MFKPVSFLDLGCRVMLIGVNLFMTTGHGRRLMRIIFGWEGQPQQLDNFKNFIWVWDRTGVNWPTFMPFKNYSAIEMVLGFKLGFKIFHSRNSNAAGSYDGG